MLQWTNDRWHCDGRGIHAGDTLELLCNNGWLSVRVESRDCGRALVAYATIMGTEFARSIATGHDTLRWPRVYA